MRGGRYYYTETPAAPAAPEPETEPELVS
jgi:hypothetical protein